MAMETTQSKLNLLMKNEGSGTFPLSADLSSTKTITLEGSSETGGDTVVEE
ncbi:hypothetical protein [Pantoea sp. BS_1]|uniref:hypothetical protein n=1 Tax=Pantoea sp. BS_1 TaxID=3055779 RepID=UPI003F7E8465